VDAGTNVNIEGEEFISLYNSSDWAERGFCKKCGSHLFYRLKEQKQYFVPFGILSNTEQHKFTNQIFIDKKPAQYRFANETKDLTEAQVFAKFTAGAG
jgi:hypothetical protein